DRLKCSQSFDSGADPAMWTSSRSPRIRRAGSPGENSYPHTSPVRSSDPYVPSVIVCVRAGPRAADCSVIFDTDGCRRWGRVKVKHFGDRCARETAVQDLELVTRDERRMFDAARAREGEELLAERHDVVGKPSRLERRIESTNEPSIVRRDPGRTVIRVAALRLNASNREQRLASD